jgi:hypothetical protein
VDTRKAAELEPEDRPGARVPPWSSSWRTGRIRNRAIGRACLGLLNLAKTYGEERLEAACRRALTIGSPTRKRILAILEGTRFSG